MSMDERKKRILHAIIKDYVNTAEPVGSRTISKNYDLGISPATVRNEMADLEEQGYIEQPHTSAGRIPSDKGYRYYVDCLMELKKPSKSEVDFIEKALSQEVLEIDNILRKSCNMLSSLTNYTALILASTTGNGSLQTIRLMPFSEQEVLAMLVTDKGFLHHRLLVLDEPISAEELKAIELLLQKKLFDLTMSQVNKTLLQELKSQLNKQEKVLEEAMYFLDESLNKAGKSLLYTGGTANMLSQPEFQDIKKVKSILEAIEGESIIKKMLSYGKNMKGAEISIGMEIPFESINQCSVITAAYTIDGEVLGTVGVLGPKRMSYSKVVSLVELITDQLTYILNKDINNKKIN